MRPTWVTDPRPGQLFYLYANGAFCVRFIRYDEQGLMVFHIEKDPQDLGDTSLFDALVGARFEVDSSTWHDEAQSLLRPVVDRLASLPT